MVLFFEAKEKGPLLRVSIRHKERDMASMRDCCYSNITVVPYQDCQ